MNNTITFKIMDVEEGVHEIEVPRPEAWQVAHYLLGALEGTETE